MSKLYFLIPILIACAPPKSGNEDDGQKQNQSAGGSSRTTPKQNAPFHQQKSTSCTRAPAQLTGAKLQSDQLSLDGNEGVNSFFANDPLLSKLQAVTLEIMVKKKSGKTATCTGVIGFSSYEMWAARGSDFSKKSFVFPKIVSAAHCFAEDNDMDIDSISFVLSSDPSQKALFNVVTSDPQTANLQDNGATVWLYNPSSIALGLPHVECSEEKGACFSAFQDRIEFVTKTERTFKTDIYSPSLSKPKRLNLPILDSLAKTAPYLNKDASEFLPALSQTLDYKKILSSAVNRSLSSASSDQHFLLRVPAKSKDEFIKSFNDKVDQIVIVRPVRGKEDAPFYALDKPVSGWSEVFDFKLDDNPSGVIFDSIVMKNNMPHLGSGDSGSQLVARYETLNTGSNLLMSAEFGVETIGTLSFVDKKPVCSGDDLLCCERSE